ncbi:PREDICTED: glutathione S-transferase U18-like [Ipomoea nil]|uniref:glutathione S-transferase U18-like n=1 Tax=Ipomoea nil TaxID=35883 RepID=UPI000900CAAB|nr:PREDICTED: glutathione S-transferase U18-like [Ipomoea nil]
MAATGEVKVLGTWWSPFALRTIIALNLKSVDYELIEETFVPKSELLLKLNPIFKKIPVLVHNDKPISESLITVQYINDVWTSGPSIVPSDPYDCAIANFWSYYIDDQLISNLRAISAAGDDKVAKKAAIDKVVEGLVPLEEAFKSISNGKKFFGGDTIGYLDIALGSFIGWFKVAEALNEDVKLLDETKVPNLVKWVGDFVDDSAVKDVFPAIDKLVEFARVFLSKRT